MSATQDGFRLERPTGYLDVHDLSGGEPGPGAPVVVGVHGITANGLSWTRVAEVLSRRRGPGSVRFVAPDLRGRAGSREAPGPYGLTVHADDVLALGEVFGVRPVVVGHSMGAFVTALAAARAPQRLSGAVLVDGGFAFPPPADLDIDAMITAVIGPAMDRLSMRFAGPEAYLDFWRAHPAVGPLLGGPWGPQVQRYVLHDLVPLPGGDAWGSSCVLEAIRADGADVLASAETHTAAAKAVTAGVPVEFLWAQRGLMDEPQGLYDDARIAALSMPEAVRVTAVPGANHYSAVFDDPGVTAVVNAVERMLDSA